MAFKPGVLVSLLIMFILCSCIGIYVIKFGRDNPDKVGPESFVASQSISTPVPTEPDPIHPAIATQWSHDIDKVAEVAKFGLVTQASTSIANAFSSWAWVLMIALGGFLVMKLLGAGSSPKDGDK